jgi:hypothetical protein
MNDTTSIVGLVFGFVGVVSIPISVIVVSSIKNHFKTKKQKKADALKRLQEKYPVLFDLEQYKYATKKKSSYPEGIKHKITGDYIGYFYWPDVGLGAKEFVVLPDYFCNVLSTEDIKLVREFFLPIVREAIAKNDTQQARKDCNTFAESYSQVRKEDECH